MQGTAALVVIAAAADFLMGWFEKQLRGGKRTGKKLWLPLGAAVCLLLVLAPFAGKKPQGLLLYDGDYSETQIMTRMAKMLIEDRTGLNVTIQDQMSQVNNFNTLKGDNHSCDLMIRISCIIINSFISIAT